MHKDLLYSLLFSLFTVFPFVESAGNVPLDDIPIKSTKNYTWNEAVVKVSQETTMKYICSHQTSWFYDDQSMSFVILQRGKPTLNIPLTSTKNLQQYITLVPDGKCISSPKKIEQSIAQALTHEIDETHKAFVLERVNNPHQPLLPLERKKINKKNFKYKKLCAYLKNPTLD